MPSQRLFRARGRGKLSALRYALFHRWTKLICLINTATKFPLSKLISISPSSLFHFIFSSVLSPFSFSLPLPSTASYLSHINCHLIAAWHAKLALSFFYFLIEKSDQHAQREKEKVVGRKGDRYRETGVCVCVCVKCKLICTTNF